MISDYREFLKFLDEDLKNIFESQKKYIKCKKGCSICCEMGEYPLSLTEFSHLMMGFMKLPISQQIIVKANIKKLIQDKENFEGDRFEYRCPFLINKECSVYDYRGIICRTFGLCYYDEENKYVRLPDCVNNGLNYSEYYDKKTKTLGIEDIPSKNLRTDKILEQHGLLNDSIQPMIEWFQMK